MSLNLLLDSADPGIWEELYPLGLFSGITTNPTLLKKSNQSCDISNLKNLSQIAIRLGCESLHLQAWGESSKEIIHCGKSLARLGEEGINIHVKIPITKNGVKAAKELIQDKISITFTACYEVKQVIIAAAIGASYIAPYLGRINDEGRNGIQELLAMQKTLTGLKSNCKILVASLRDSNELCKLSSEGISSFTISPNLAIDLLKVDSTIEASKQFERDSKAWLS